MKPGSAAIVEQEGPPDPRFEHSARDRVDLAVDARVVQSYCLVDGSGAAGLDGDDAGRAEVYRGAGIARAADGLVEAHRRRRVAGEVGAFDQRVGRKRLLDALQVEIVDRAEQRPRAVAVVCTVGVRSEGGVVAQHGARVPQRPDVVTGGDLALHAPVPLLRERRDESFQLVGIGGQADRHAGRNELSYCADVRGQAHAVAPQPCVDERAVERGARSRVAFDRVERRADKGSWYQLVAQHESGSVDRVGRVRRIHLSGAFAPADACVGTHAHQ